MTASGMVEQILSFFAGLKLTFDLLRYIRTKSEKPLSFGFEELLEATENAEIDYGSRVSVTGTHSDFLPIARELMFDCGGEKVLFDPLPCRPFEIEGRQCCALQSDDSEFAGDPVCVPVFYKHDTKRPTIHHLSGRAVEVTGTLVTVTDAWKRILDVSTPVAIQAETIDIIGDEKAGFGVAVWSIARSRSIPIAEGHGQILSSDDFWSLTQRIDTERVFMMNGGKMIRRHGRPDEPYETVWELYLTNILNEDEFNGVSRYLRSRTSGGDDKRRKADVIFDTVAERGILNNWLWNKLSLPP